MGILFEDERLLLNLLRGTRIAIIIASVGICACASIPVLHNKGDFQKITEAKETHGKVDYTKVIRQEREVQTKILDQELRVIADFTNAQRDMALLNMMTSDKVLSTNLKERIRARLTKVAGSGFPELKDIFIDDLAVTCDTELKGCGDRKMLEIPTGFPAGDKPVWIGFWILKLVKVGLGRCSQRLTIARDDYHDDLGFRAPICPFDGNIEALDDNVVAELVKKYRNAHPTSQFSDEDITKWIKNQHKRVTDVCRQVRSVEVAVRVLIAGCEGEICGPMACDTSTIEGLKNSLLAAAYRRLDAARTALVRDKQAAKDAEDAYKTAKNAYETAAKQHLDAPSNETREMLEKLGDDVEKAIKAAKQAGDVFGVELISKEQIAQIDLLLAAAASGKVDTEAVEKNPKLATAAAISAALPGFVDRAKFIKTLSEAPPLSGLILEKARMLALTNEAMRAAARREQEVRLLERKKVAFEKEIEFLIEAWQLVKEAESRDNSFSIDDLLSRSTDQKKQRRQRAMVRALQQYLISYTVPRREERSMEYQLIALTHAQALDRSETSLKIWNAAIETPINSLLAYHGSGLTPEDIIQLLQAVGLGAIAAGVN